MTRERLQKVLARAGVASRRQVEEMIREGRVTINGDVAELGQRADLDDDAVKVDGKRILPSRQRPVYLLLNKPRGVVSTRHDPEGRRTVLDLVPPGYHKGLVPVGRLDFDTEGLLILTTDGDFAQRVAHPRHGCVKTYEVKVKGEPDDNSIERLRGGMVIDGKRTAPAAVEAFPGPRGRRERTANSWWRVGLTEGRTRQVREMFHRVGHPVQRLRRVAIGHVVDNRLPRGEWRELTPEEVERLRDDSGGSPLLGRKRRPGPRGRRGRAGDDGRGRRGPKGRGPKGRGSKGSRGPKGGGSRGGRR